MIGRRKINLWALNIFMFLGIAIFAKYPNTYSRYIETGDDYLKYNSRFVSLASNQASTAKEMEIKANSDVNVTFHFDLIRNSSALGTNDEYAIILDNYRCHSVINNVKTDKIVFSEEELNNDPINVDIVCDTTNSYSGWLGVTAMVTERVNNAARAFGYMQYKVTRYNIPEIVNKASDSNTIEVKDEETVLTIKDPTSKESKNRLINWLNKDDLYKDYIADVTAYVENIDSIDNLRGIVKVNDTYDVNADFLGYARTFSENRGASETLVMYFSNEPIETIFREYLNDYFDSNDLNLLNNYIELKGGFTNLLNDSDTYFSYENKVLTLDKNILNSIVKSKTFSLSRNASMNSIFQSLLEKKNIVLDNSSDVFEFVSTANDVENAKKNMLIKNNEDYILFNIEINEDYNIINFLDVAISQDSDELTNVRVELLDNMVKEELDVLEIKEELAKYFEGEITLNEDGEVTTLVFNVKKIEETPSEPTEPTEPSEPDLPDPKPTNPEDNTNTNGDDTSDIPQEDEGKKLEETQNAVPEVLDSGEISADSATSVSIEAPDIISDGQNSVDINLTEVTNIAK